MESVTHHGRAIAYEYWDRNGDGPPVCFVHGSGSTHTIWKSQQRLADRFPVVALDLSGHGDSEDIDANHGYMALSAYADDVIAVLEATDARVLVGHSLGGAIVMHLCIERSPDIDAVVLTGTGARLGVLSDLLEWLETDFERALSFLHAPDRLYHNPSDDLRRTSKEQMRAVGQRVTCRDFYTCHEFDVRDRLDEIDVPALTLCGTHDQLTPPWYHDYLATHIKTGECIEIDDAAHMVMVERPDVFNDAIEDFLATNVPAY